MTRSGFTLEKGDEKFRVTVEKFEDGYQYGRHVPFIVRKA